MNQYDYKLGSTFKHNGKTLKVESTKFWRHDKCKGTLIVVSDGCGNMFDFNISDNKQQIYI